MNEIATLVNLSISNAAEVQQSYSSKAISNSVHYDIQTILGLPDSGIHRRWHCQLHSVSSFLHLFY